MIIPAPGRKPEDFHSPTRLGQELTSCIEDYYKGSVYDAAYHIGVSRQHLYRVMRGTSRIGQDTAARLEKTFGDRASYWLKLQGEPVKKPRSKAVGKKIREIQKRFGWKTPETASKLGISTGYLYQIMSGHVPLTRPVARKIVQHLGGMRVEEWLKLQEESQE